jgi:hypothetical protein
MCQEDQPKLKQTKGLAAMFLDFDWMAVIVFIDADKINPNESYTYQGKQL